MHVVGIKMVVLGDAHSCSLPFFTASGLEVCVVKCMTLKLVNSQADDPRVTPGRSLRSFSLPWSRASMSRVSLWRSSQFDSAQSQLPVCTETPVRSGLVWLLWVCVLYFCHVFVGLEQFGKLRYDIIEQFGKQRNYIFCGVQMQIHGWTV